MDEITNDTFLQRTQNVCLHCDIKIYLMGRTWWHRAERSPRNCPGTEHLDQRPVAEPKFAEGSPEQLKAIHT